MKHHPSIGGGNEGGDSLPLYLTTVFHDELGRRFHAWSLPVTSDVQEEVTGYTGTMHFSFLAYNITASSCGNGGRGSGTGSLAGEVGRTGRHLCTAVPGQTGILLDRHGEITG